MKLIRVVTCVVPSTSEVTILGVSGDDITIPPHGSFIYSIDSVPDRRYVYASMSSRTGELEVRSSNTIDDICVDFCSLNYDEDLDRNGSLYVYDCWEKRVTHSFVSERQSLLRCTSLEQLEVHNSVQFYCHVEVLKHEESWRNAIWMVAARSFTQACKVVRAFANFSRYRIKVSCEPTQADSGYVFLEKDGVFLKMFREFPYDGPIYADDLRSTYEKCTPKRPGLRILSQHDDDSYLYHGGSLTDGDIETQV